MRHVRVIWLAAVLIAMAVGCAESDPGGPGLDIQIFTPGSPNLDPIPAGMPTIRVTARDNITGKVLKSSTFGVGDTGARFSGLPFHDNIQLVVEGLDASDLPIYRGMSTPFGFREGSNDRRVPILFTQINSFSEATTLTVGGDGNPVVQPVRFAVGLTRGGHVQTPLPGGRVLFTGGAVLGEGNGLEFDYVPGGLSLTESIASVEVYDPAAGNFFALSDMVTPRAFHTTTQLADGRILVIGGVTVIETDDGPVLETVRVAEIFDPATQRWTQITGEGSLNTGRAWHTATLRRIDGKVVIIGGRNITRGAATLLGDAEIFNPDTNRFERNTGDAAIEMAEPRAEHTAVLMRAGLGVGSDVLVFGGIGEDGTTVAQIEVLRAVNNNTLFEFSTDSLPRMQTPRYSHDSIAVTPEGGNLILSLGGIGDDGRAVPNIEVYDISTADSFEVGNLVTARSHVKAVELPFTQKIVVVGGLDSSGQTLNSAESLAYNVVNGRYGSVPVTSSMITPRYLHNITLLSNGLILLTGGVGQEGGGTSSLNTVEIFNPDDGSPVPLSLTQ